MKQTIIILMILLMAATVASEPVLMPYDCSGTATNSFDVGEDICVYGVGFDEGSEVDILLVEDKDTYNDGDTLDIVASETVSTEGFVLGLTKIWTAVKSGFYDLFVDADKDGKVSEGDSVNLIEGAGVVVHGEEVPPEIEVPEFSTLTALIALIGAGMMIRRRKK